MSRNKTYLSDAELNHVVETMKLWGKKYGEYMEICEMVTGSPFVAPKFHPIDTSPLAAECSKRRHEIEKIQNDFFKGFFKIRVNEMAAQLTRLEEMCPGMAQKFMETIKG